MSTPDKSTIITLLDRWIRQRPGLEYGNYGEPTSYRAEVRSIGRDLAHARQLLRAVELSGITGEELAAAFPRAYSGRLTLHQDDKGAWRLNYCAGQYWPTEYRSAVCAVLAAALWSYKREHCMPPPSYVVGGKRTYDTRAEAEERAADGMPYSYAVEECYKGKSAGDWLRTSFRREFGRGIANRWFD